MAFAAAAPIIGSVVGGLFSRRGAKDANQASAAMAREQMAFQERMSNTAHQREIKDLLAAGLNPILSATGGAGASTPSGASSTFQNEMEGFEGLSQATVSAFQVRNMRQELLNAQKTWELLEEQRRKTGNDADISANNAEITRLQRKFLDQYGPDNAAAASRTAIASAQSAENQLPEQEAIAKLWRDLGEGGEAAKALGSAAPIIKMLMSIFGRK